MPIAGLTGIFEQNPTWRSIEFGGRHINLSALGRAIGYKRAMVCRFFNGSREPKLSVMRAMASAMGMTLDEFEEHYLERLRKVRKERERAIQTYLNRVNRELEEDLKTFHNGKIPAPRMPGLRVKLDK